MSPGLKRILLILALLTVSALLAWAIYTLFFKAAPPVIPLGGTRPVGTTGQLPGAGERVPGAGEIAPGAGQPGVLPAGGTTPLPPPSYFTPEPVSQIGTEAALFPSVDAGGDLRYHNPADGKFYQLLPNGQAQALSDQVFYNVNKVTWAKTANKAVLEYPDSSKIIYNFDKKTQATLPKHWEEFSFSPDSNEVAAKSLGLSPENRWLVVTKDDGTGTQLIEALGNNADRVNIDWSPSRQTVALSRTGAPQGADRQEVLFVGLNGENFKSTVVEGLDFMPQWSPSGKKLLYSVDSARTDFKPEIWVVNAYGDTIGSNRQNIKLNTWANKCSFGDDNTLFCAVPRDLPQGAGMSPKIADTIPDDLYKIDLKTGLQTNVVLGNNFHINSIFYDSVKNKVMFTDPNKKGVFQVNL
ncbi:MAG: hypothetical protein EXS55_02635 [Candidatus Magasanikbacteria bacterium]|nr:hypothetical protein [Candidatus Magasanikbacteria bacterium]